MYSKQQASQIRQEFWTTFGRYMQPVLSAASEKVNWVNYKTGAKHIYFRMHAGKGAAIAIELTHNEDNSRLESYNRLQQLSSILQHYMNEEWIWQIALEDEHGKIISSVNKEMPGVNVFNKEDWPALISFFKPRIIALDAFWNEVKHEFGVW